MQAKLVNKLVLYQYSCPNCLLVFQLTEADLIVKRKIQCGHCNSDLSLPTDPQNKKVDIDKVKKKLRAFGWSALEVDNMIKCAVLKFGGISVDEALFIKEAMSHAP